MKKFTNIGMSLVIMVCLSVPGFATENVPPLTTWDKMWEIQLINGDNRIEEDVSMEFVFFDGQKVDARTGEFYQDMEAAALADGITLYLRSGYRSIATQKYLYYEGIERYMSYGYSYSTAVSIANRYYAPPGGSEHNIGLAFDIITPEYHQTVYTLNSKFAATEAYAWLLEHCADYGFILRYPEGRTADTGINFEPWHYRYVGVEHAQYITENNLLLEEYVALYQETYPELYGDYPPSWEDGTGDQEESGESDSFQPDRETKANFSDLADLVDWKQVNWTYTTLNQVFPLDILGNYLLQ